MTTLQPRIKPMPWVSWATATTEVNITMAQGWDDGLVLPEGWQHHRYKVKVSCYPYPPPNGDMFILWTDEHCIRDVGLYVTVVGERTRLPGLVIASLPVCSKSPFSSHIQDHRLLLALYEGAGKGGGGKVRADLQRVCKEVTIVFFFAWG